LRHEADATRGRAGADAPRIPGAARVSVLVELRGDDVRLGACAAASALMRIDLRIYSGERIALVGSNGSGKSTLLRVLKGLQTVSAGGVQRHVDIRTAMLCQRPFLLRCNVLNNVALGLWLQGVRWGMARQQTLLAL